jgi:hypothetical protein
MMIIINILLLFEINFCFEAIDALCQNMPEVSHNRDKANCIVIFIANSL